MLNPTTVRSFAVVVAALWFASTTVFSTAAGDDQAPAQIRVTGEGSASLVPDMAVIGLIVMREGDTARATLDANSAAMEKVLTAMQAQGIAVKDLQTSNFSIQPRYVYPQNANNGRQPPKLVGYTVRNSLTVRVRDISKVGAILDQAVSIGVNEGGDISFTNADPSKAIETARRAAVQAAMAKAETLASAAGVKTGAFIEISEHRSTPQPMPMVMAERMMADAAAPVPVAAGENSYLVQVDITMAIVQP